MRFAIFLSCVSSWTYTWLLVWLYTLQARARKDGAEDEVVICSAEKQRLTRGEIGRKWKKWMKSSFSGFHQVSPVSWSFTNFSIFRFHQFHSFHQLHQFHEVSCFELLWREFREYTWHEARQKACSALDNFNWSPEFLDIIFCWDCCLLFFSKLDMWPRRTLQKPEMVRASESHAVRKLQLAMDILQVLQVERARSLRAKRNRTFFVNFVTKSLLHKLFFYSSWDTLIWWGKRHGCIRADGDTKARVLWAMLFSYRVEMWKLKLRWRESPSWSFEVRWNVRVSLFPNFHSTDDCDPLCKRKAESRQRIVKNWEFSHDFDDLQERNQHFLSEFPWPITKILSFFVTIFRWSASFDWSWWVLSWMHWKVWFVLIKGSVENWAVKGDVDGAKEERKKKGRAIHNVKDGCGTCETWKRNGRDSIPGIFLSSPFIFTWIDSTLSFPITLRGNFPHQAFLSWQLINSKKNWTCRHCCWHEHHKKWGVYFNLWIQKPEGNLQRGKGSVNH